jgi:hypothetical protein
MTTEETAVPAADVPAEAEREITFKERAIWVRVPSPEQLLVWKRTVSKLQSADVDGWNGSQVMDALERTRKIIDSVLVHEVDKDWLDDQMLDGNLGLIDTAQIIQLTVEAFAEGDNREARRAAQKPAKKAARKKAASR